jgi:hypothetical protein
LCARGRKACYEASFGASGASDTSSRASWQELVSRFAETTDRCRGPCRPARGEWVQRGARHSLHSRRTHRSGAIGLKSTTFRSPQNEVIGVLEHETALAASDRTMVSTILRIYGNFHDLLDRNEHDPLTGLLNRQTHFRPLTEEWGPARALKQLRTASSCTSPAVHAPSNSPIGFKSSTRSHTAFVAVRSGTPSFTAPKCPTASPSRVRGRKSPRGAPNTAGQPWSEQVTRNRVNPH